MSVIKSWTKSNVRVNSTLWDKGWGYSPSWHGMIVETLDGWSHCINSQVAERKECQCSSVFLPFPCFIQSCTRVKWMMLSIFQVSCQFIKVLLVQNQQGIKTFTRYAWAFSLYTYTLFCLDSIFQFLTYKFWVWIWFYSLFNTVFNRNSIVNKYILVRVVIAITAVNTYWGFSVRNFSASVI